MVSILRCPDLHFHILCGNVRIQVKCPQSLTLFYRKILAHAYIEYWYVCKSIFKLMFLPLSVLFIELNVTF